MNGQIFLKTKNMEYRIKIVEQNNGDKRYIPQVMTGLKKLTWFTKRGMGTYQNIISELPSVSSYSTSVSIEESWDTEEQALHVIEHYKDILSIKESKKIKNIEYKLIN
jgi:hypothetical protein